MPIARRAENQRRTLASRLVAFRAGGSPRVAALRTRVVQVVSSLLGEVMLFAGWLIAAIWGATVALLGSRHGARIARGRRHPQSGSPYRDPS